MPRAKVIYDHEGGKPWQTFLDRLSNFTCDKKGNPVQIENYDEVQIMGYFIFQIKKHFDQDFTQTLTYEGESLRHPQMRILRKIIVALNQMNKNDPYYSKIEKMPNKDQWNRQKMIAFIDWSIKRVSKKTSIFSLNYLMDQKHIDRFLSQYGKKDRSEELPEQLKKIAPDYVNTFGDLAFYSQSYMLDQSVITELDKLGVDLSIIL